VSTYHELAEAMRKGAALRPQCYSTFFTRIIVTPGQHRIVGESCALGAVYEGATGTTPRIRFEDVEKLFPGLFDTFVKCPACPDDAEPDYLINAIVDLNDTHNWKRMAIADWLDTL
jgi:hypothetical protein